MKTTLRDRPTGRLEAAFVVVAHSQNSMIAWDVLRDLDPAKISVPLSSSRSARPLGLDECRTSLRSSRTWADRCPFHAADRLVDPIALDGNLANDFTPGSGITDVCADRCSNPDSPGSPHSGTGFTCTSGGARCRRGRGGVGTLPARAQLRHHSGPRRQPRGPSRSSGTRCSSSSPVCAGPAGDGASAALVLDRTRAPSSLKIFGSDEATRAAARSIPLRRYVTAKLTRLIEALSVSCRAHIDTSGRTRAKSALLWLSTQKIQAIPRRDHVRRGRQRDPLGCARHGRCFSIIRISGRTRPSRPRGDCTPGSVIPSAGRVQPP